MRIEVHPSGSKSYLLLICTTKEEAKWLYDFAPIDLKLEAKLENPKVYNFPHIIIRIPEVKP